MYIGRGHLKNLNRKIRDANLKKNGCQICYLYSRRLSFKKAAFAYTIVWSNVFSGKIIFFKCLIFLRYCCRNTIPQIWPIQHWRCSPKMENKHYKYSICGPLDLGPKSQIYSVFKLRQIILKYNQFVSFAYFLENDTVFQLF